MTIQQAFVQHRNLLATLAWRALLVLVFVYIFAAFVDGMVLPTASRDWKLKAYESQESAYRVLADAADQAHAKLWK